MDDVTVVAEAVQVVHTSLYPPILRPRLCAQNDGLSLEIVADNPTGDLQSIPAQKTGFTSLRRR
jgi:hypothetical protein